jgi:CheY-like chemotaxis protein
MLLARDNRKDLCMINDLQHEMHRPLIGKHILLVSSYDRPGIRQLIDLMLEEGHWVTCLDTAAAAIEMLTLPPGMPYPEAPEPLPYKPDFLRPDLVLLNMPLSDMEGADLLRQVLACGQTLPPVIVLAPGAPLELHQTFQTVPVDHIVDDTCAPHQLATYVQQSLNTQAEPRA